MILAILAFILILSVLILIHEFGHFIVARRNGILVDEFAFGFPPRLWSIKKGDTTYALNAIPIGGYVKMKGEDSAEKGDDSFSQKSIWIRIKVIVAGVTLNLLLGIFLIFLGFFTVGMPQGLDQQLLTGAIISDKKVIITQVQNDFPAKEAGLKSGDMILGVNNLSVSEIQNVQEYVSANLNQELIIKIQRSGEEKEIKTTTKVDENGKPRIGIAMAQSGVVKYPFVSAVKAGFLGAYNVCSSIIGFIGGLIFGAVSVETAKESVGGPIAIFNIVEQATSLGLAYFISIFAMLSITLAVMNILPFPALDGSRLVFLVIEKFRGRAMASHIEGTIHTIGFAVLLLLMAVITYNDIMR